MCKVRRRNEKNNNKGLVMDIKDIKNVMDSIIDGSDKELFSRTQEELEKYWYFKYDDKKDAKRNTYEFYDMLKLYEHFCERWEEHFNGSICIVERVRDKYLMPKIKVFLEDLSRMGT